MSLVAKDIYNNGGIYLQGSGSIVANCSSYSVMYRRRIYGNGLNQPETYRDYGIVYFAYGWDNNTPPKQAYAGIYCPLEKFFDQSRLENIQPSRFYGNTASPTTAEEVPNKITKESTTVIDVVDFVEAIQWYAEMFTKFHSDPVYIEATKLKYTDGTYNFIKGVANETRSRKAAYNHLLNTYGTFYKGTEQELANSFATGLDDPSINGGGVTKDITPSFEYDEYASERMVA